MGEVLPFKRPAQKYWKTMVDERKASRGERRNEIQFVESNVDESRT